MTELETIFSPENMVAPTNMQVVEPTVETQVTTSTEPVIITEPTTTATPTEPVITNTTTSDPVKTWLKEKLGVEDDTLVIDRFKKYDEVSLQAQELAKQKQELETQNKELASKPTYKSDFAKKADEIFEVTKGNVSKETIARFYGLDPKELKDDEALDLVKQIESPTLTAEERAILRNEEYGVGDEMLTEGQKIQRKDKYSQDVTIAREKLSKLASEAFKPVSTNNQPTAEEINAEANRVNFWQQNTDKIDSSIFKKESAIKLKVPNGRGGVDEIDNNFTYSIPEDKKQQIYSVVAQELTKPANAKFFTPDKEGIDRANTYMRSVVNNAIFDETLKAQQKHFEQAISTVHEHYAKLLNNTDFLNGVQTPKSGTAGVVDYNQSVADYLQRSGA